MEPNPLVELQGISKRFAGVTANSGIDFDLYRGEVHALLGENGAGKSTLMSILCGLHRPDAGRIFIKGEPVVLRSAQDAIRRGLEMVHQHFQLVPRFSVLENVMLGQPSSRWPLLDGSAEVRRRIGEIAGRYRLAVDPDAPVWQLSVGEQQRVEILKALYRGAEALILDEPTAALTPQEAQALLAIIEALAGQGVGIVFISHKLKEVLAIADRITVLRDGRVAGSRRPEATDRRELARLMVGRELSFEVDKTPGEPGPVRLAIEQLWVADDRALAALRGVSLEVRAGEILGLAGVAGNGQRELEEALRGLRPAQGGRIVVEDRPLNGRTPAEIIAMGVGHIPGDRYAHGLLNEFSVAENLVLETFWRPPYSRRGLLDRKAIAANAAEQVRRYDLRPPQPALAAGKLSGGNAQKLVLARQLSLNPKVLIAAQPTRGLDINASQYLHRRLLEQRERGVAILLISAELDEIFTLSDRVAVIYEGRIMGELPGQRRYTEDAGLLMAGHALH